MSGKSYSKRYGPGKFLTENFRLLGCMKQREDEFNSDKQSMPRLSKQVISVLKD